MSHDESEGEPAIPLRLKVETNTREHFAVYGLKKVPFSINSRWFAGTCEINSYDLDELLGTKLRALYQRRAGRDLFDLATALTSGKVHPERIVEAFLRLHGTRRPPDFARSVREEPRGQDA